MGYHRIFYQKYHAQDLIPLNLSSSTLLSQLYKAACVADVLDACHCYIDIGNFVYNYIIYIYVQ